MNHGVPRPLWIDANARAIFAWHHPPLGNAREASVVLCKPFGFEAACSHRAYRHLAQRLAEAGFHVLRLDYHGTGDSSGGDSDDDRVPAWLDSVRAAMDWLRARSGVGKVVLFGARFGALVALEMAARDDVDALVLLAPPVSGRAWLREGRALQSLIEGNGRKRVPIPGGGEQSAGFLLTRPTVDALTKLDPLASARTARAVLLIARDDLPGAEGRLASKLEALGAEVKLSTTPGYGTMMHHDPHMSIVPDVVWSEITGWLTARYALSSIPATSATYSHVAIVRENRAAPPVREEAVDMDGLFGVLTEPIESAAASSVPAVILHNIGANSHIGSNRMYVGMARRWAALGFRVLRFDSAGLGDSPANAHVAENRVYSQNAIVDSRRAMDFLARARGARRFVLMGLCSGAYVSFHAGVADPRIAGIVLMNILLFHWKEGDPIDIRKRDTVKSTRFYARALLEREPWVRLLRGDVHLSAIAQGLLQKGWERARFRIVQMLAGESDVARGFRTLMQREVEVLLVFAAEDGGRDLIDEHLGTDGERFRHERGFRMEVIDGTDHTFSLLWSQEALVALLANHLTTRFAPERSFAINARNANDAQVAAVPPARLGG
jgi:pimeloyl-ACP methyl ester carboxylesterase